MAITWAVVECLVCHKNVYVRDGVRIYSLCCPDYDRSVHWECAEAGRVQIIHERCVHCKRDPHWKRKFALLLIICTIILCLCGFNWFTVFSCFMIFLFAFGDMD